VINPHYLGTHCNIVENARMHVGKKHIWNIDLKDFFPSISAQRITALFTSPCFKYDEQIANALTLLTTCEGRLPTGAPTSPVLSNFVCRELDNHLCNYCNNNTLQFTRYADDLTFSSNTMITQETIQQIITIINENGFEINRKKLRLQSSYRRQTVTGLTVNEKVNVNRKLLKKIRAMQHDLNTNGLDIAARRHFKVNFDDISDLRHYFLNRLNGYIGFMGQVRGRGDEVYRKMKEKL
jgi:RNA-directed DNA polymerase